MQERLPKEGEPYFAKILHMAINPSKSTPNKLKRAMTRLRQQIPRRDAARESDPASLKNIPDVRFSLIPYVLGSGLTFCASGDFQVQNPKERPIPATPEPTLRHRLKQARHVACSHKFH
jgi:hypothetical protein